MRVSNSYIYLAAIIGLAFAQNPRFSGCNANNLNTCQQQFNLELTLDSSLGVTNYKQLRDAVEKSFANGKSYGLLATCQAFKNYKNCFSDPIDFFACTQNPFGLLTATNTQTKYSKEQAYGYIKIWNQLDFVCGAGFGIFANSEDCSSAVFQNRTADIRECDTNFSNSVTQDPLQVCSYVEIAANCYRQIFWNACQKPEVAFFGCNYERTGTQLNYPQCSQIFCTFHEIFV